MPTVIAYSLLQVVKLAVPGLPSGATMITSNYHTRPDFKIFRGVANTIDFLIRDIDRQPVAITNTQSVIVTLANFDTGETLLRSTLTSIDPTQGQFRLSINAVTASSFDLGTLIFTPTLLDSGTETMLFTDRDYGPRAAVEVVEGPQPPVPAPIVVQAADMTPMEGFFYAGSYPGAAVAGNLTGQHSLALYTNGFTGTMTVEGTVEAQPPSTEGWFDVATQTYSDVTGIQPLSFVGNLTWVRFKVTTTTGVEQIIYTN